MPESLSSFWATGKHWKTPQQTCVTNDCTKRRFSALFWYPWHHRPRPVKICTYRRLRLKAAFQLPKESRSSSSLCISCCTEPVDSTVNLVSDGVGLIGLVI